MTDPWATASNKTSSADPDQRRMAPNGDAHVMANAVANAENPFMTAQDATPAGGGQFDPFVPNAYLEGRAVVMVPKSFTDQAPKAESIGGGVQDRWTVDLIILDGGPLNFTYQAREEKDGPKVEKTCSVSEFPATFRGQWVQGGQLVAALNGANKNGAFIYGVFSKVPVMQDQRAGKTVESLAEEFKQWRQNIANGVPGTPTNAPRHTFNLDSRPHIFTPERVNLAMQWWEQEKANRLNTAS